VKLVLALVAALAAQDSSPRFAPDPARAEVGQPVRFVLALEHDPATRVTLAEGDPFAPKGSESAPALVADGPPELAREALPDGRVRTAFVWTARALEGGSWAPASAALALDGPEGERALVALAEPLEVAPALAEGEDAPQPPTDFPPAPPERTGGLVLAALALVLLAGGAALALLLARLARRRAPARAPAPSAEERLDALGPRAARPGEEGALARELVALVRGTLDGALGARRDAFADEEWLAALEAEARLAPEERALARNLLLSLEAARYGGPRPTRFALEEAIARARALVDAARRIEAEARAPAKRGRAA
jgi:hypothetical protein